MNTVQHYFTGRINNAVFFFCTRIFIRKAIHVKPALTLLYLDDIKPVVLGILGILRRCSVMNRSLGEIMQTHTTDLLFVRI